MDNREVKEAECNNNDFSFVCEYDCSSVGKKVEDSKMKEYDIITY